MENVLEKFRTLLFRLPKTSSQKGICYVVRRGIRKIEDEIRFQSSFFVYKMSGLLRTFAFHGETYHYFYHKYNSTWESERAIEVPIIWKIVKENRERRILEIGNVLSHYFVFKHDIVDKYEKAKGVINQDVIDFQPPKKYDLIVSISTLEHIGWDEKPRDCTKILRAIENLESLLDNKGRIVVLCQWVIILC